MMICHLVLFRLKPGIAKNDPRIARLQSGMARLPEAIGSIRGWSFGANQTDDAEAWDFGLHAVFENREALLGYFDHPAHLAVLDRWQELAELGFADFAL